MFFVVEFGNHTVEVIPDNWMSTCGTWCYWPPFRGQTMTDAISGKRQPEVNWKKSKITRVRSKSGRFV